MKNYNFNKLILRRNYIYGFIFVSLLGTLGHFLYNWTGENRIIGLVTAVNESAWEHMKLLFFPMLIYTIILRFKFHKDVTEITPVMLLSTFIGTGLIPVLFYTYTGILGFMISSVNIVIFYVSAAFSFILAYIITNKHKFKNGHIILYIIILLFTCMFFIFTYNPPQLGIFRVPSL